MVGIVVSLLVVIGVGISFLRETDPHAVADRDAAESALLTTGDLGGTFAEIDHRAFARSRGGVRVSGGIAECAPSDNEFERDGQAVVDSVLEAQTGVSAQIIAEEIVVMGSPDTATPLLESMTATARRCVVAAVQAGAPKAGIAISIAPAPAPDLGDRAAAFEGSMTVPGSSLVASVEILIVQQGRAIVLLAAIDTTGSLHGSRLASMAGTMLMRLAPRFGT